MQPFEALRFPLTGCTDRLVMCVELFGMEEEKPQPGLTPDWGFSLRYHSYPWR